MVLGWIVNTASCNLKHNRYECHFTSRNKLEAVRTSPEVARIIPEVGKNPPEVNIPEHEAF